MLFFGLVAGFINNAGTIEGDEYGIISGGSSSDLTGGVINSGEIISGEGSIYIVSGGDISGGIDKQVDGVIDSTGYMGDGGIVVDKNTIKSV